MTNIRMLSTLLALLAAAWSPCMGQTLVMTGQARKMAFHDQVNLVSRTEAVRNSKVVATVSGSVLRIDAAEGAIVKKGAPLVSIAPQQFQMALDAKQAEAMQAKARADAARRALERSKGLFARQLISESIIDTDSTTYVAALERFRQLQAEKARLADDLANCRIRAPFSGITGQQLIDVGEWVNPGTPVFELVDPSVIKVTVDLPEKYFGQVATGSTVMVYRSGGDGDARPGRVTGISPSALQATHTFPVFVSVANEDGYLGGGMLVKVALSLNQQFTSLAVSKDAIVREGLQTSVYTIKDGKAVRIPVTTSSTEGEMVAVKGEGLRDGLSVIIRGNERISPGGEVRLQKSRSDSQSVN